MSKFLKLLTGPCWILATSTLTLHLASCSPGEPTQQAATPAAKNKRTAAGHTAMPGIAELTRHYADLMAQQTPLPTPQSRQNATPVGRPEEQLFTRKLPSYEVLFALNKQQQLHMVEIKSPRIPEDPNRLAKYQPQPAAHLVRLGELRRVFGQGAEASGPGNKPHDYDFSYRPSPDKRQITIRAFVPAFVYADSAMVEYILILPPD